MPAPINYEFRRSGNYLGECAGPNMVNEEIIVASGQGVLYPGQILGRITASKKFVAHDPAGADGSQTPAGILFHKVDATSADVTTVATRRGPATINGNDLIHKGSLNATQQAAAIEGLRGIGLSVLPQRA
jgi:hypothetical protein